MYLKRLFIENIILSGRLSEKDYIQKVQSLLLGYVVILDIKGKRYTSENFSAFFMNLQEVHKHITFVCGPADGIPLAIKNLANETVSLSDMTLPHELARIILVEQLYRAKQIWANHPYHKY